MNNKEIVDELGGISDSLNSPIGMMTVAAMSGDNPEVREAHNLLLKVANSVDDLIDKLL